jgi:uncharacterized membrane protein
MADPQTIISPTYMDAMLSGLMLHRGTPNVLAHSVVTIDKPAEELYERWKDLASIPLWQERMISVTPLSGRTSHWVMGEGDKKIAEWDSEITADEPGKRIGWRSVDGDVNQAGEMRFEAAPGDRGTIVILAQGFEILGGKLGNVTAGILGRSPRQTVVENLRHFKQWTESGEIPTIKGQPTGPRGVSGHIKEFSLGETNPTPPGTQRSA